MWKKVKMSDINNAFSTMAIIAPNGVEFHIHQVVSAFHTKKLR